MRVGFFGGTFDPPHTGHLAVACAAVAEFALARLLVAPTGRQPLKVEAPGASFADRLAMTEILCAGQRALEASALEAPTGNDAPNYTIDTLRRLRAELTPDDEIFVVVGADAFLGLRRWHEPDALLASAEWIVVSRPGFSLSELEDLRLDTAQLSRVHLLGDVEVPVSATEIRRRLRDGEDCSGMLTPGVRAYIGEHGLYRAT